MTRVLPRGRPGAAVLLGLLAAGCSGGATPPPPCPRPAIVEGLDVLEQRTGTGPTDFAWRASMTGFGGGCRYEGDGVALRIALDLAVVPGPARAASTGPIEIPWFVAVADPAGQVIAKEVFRLRLESLPAPSPRVMVEQIDQKIAGVTPADGAAWRVYLGFELSPEEGLKRRRELGR